MSELISGKEAFDAAYNGNEAQWRWTGKDVEWRELKGTTAFSIDELKGGVCEFRLKPRTVNLNGVEVGQLYSSQWDREKPNKVTLEFKTEYEARYFNSNALKIFNGV